MFLAIETLYPRVLDQPVIAPFLQSNLKSQNLELFVTEFKTRIKDIYVQDWHDSLINSTRASFYRVYKQSFKYSSYLDIVFVKSHRDALTRLLSSSHILHVESGRWRRNPELPRERRYCFICTAKVEDEYHFVFECPIYRSLRIQLIPRYYRERPSMFKFISLLNTTNKKHIIALAKFVYKAFAERRLFISGNIIHRVLDIRSYMPQYL